MTTIENIASSFLFVADAHIKSRTWTNSMLLHGDAYQVLEELADKHQYFSNTETIVIGGDWFDSDRPTSEDVLASVKFLERFKNIYYIRGNHDKKEPSFLQLMDYLEAEDHMLLNLESAYVFLTEDLQTAITGLNYIDSREELLGALNRVHKEAQSQNIKTLYLVLHQSFQHLFPFDGYKLSSTDIENIFTDMTIRVLVGHIHIRDTMHLHGSSYIHSPGSLYPTAIDKPKAIPAATLVRPSLDADDLTDIICPVRMYADTEFTDDASLKELIDVILEENDSEHYLKPCLWIHVPADKDLNLLQSDYPGIVLLVTKDVAEIDPDKPETTHEGPGYSIRQAIEDEASSSDEVKELALTLFDADDPVAEIDAWLQFWKVERIV